MNLYVLGIAVTQWHANLFPFHHRPVSAMDAPMDVDLSDRPHSLVHIFSRHPIYDNIFSCLTPLALTRMASVNRAIRAVTKDFTARAYNVNRRLSRFFSDSFIFRSLMARVHMVISGSFALQFFDRTYYPDSDLDLYLHPDRNIIDVGLYLQQEGYAFLPESWQLKVFKDEAERICANIDIDAPTEGEVDDWDDEEEGPSARLAPRGIASAGMGGSPLDAFAALAVWICVRKEAARCARRSFSILSSRKVFSL